MRFTIERIRTLVVVAAVLLLVALGVFLVRAKWKSLLSWRDLPQRLGVGITEESNGYTLLAQPRRALQVQNSCREGH